MKPRRPRQLDAAGHIIRVVVPLQRLQLGWPKALRPEAEPIDTRLPQHLEILARSRGRVHLDRPLRYTRQVKPLL